MKIKKLNLYIMLLIIMMTAAGCQGINGDKVDDVLSASGSLAADEIKIASEIGGLIKQINVMEGDQVDEGDLLIAVDDAIFQAEKARAEAGLKAARAGVNTAEAQVISAELQFQLVVQGATSGERAFRAQEWTMPMPVEIDLPIWYYQKGEQLEIVRQEVMAAEERLESQQEKLYAELNANNNQDFLEVEQTLHAEQIAFLVAKHTLERAQSAAQRDELLDVAQEAYDAVLASLESAQLDYERELNTQAAEDILEARAKVAAAQSDLDYVRDQLMALETGEESLQVEAARAGVSLAEAGLAQARAMAEQARAGLDVLLAQEEKLTAESPVDGVVLSLNVMEGEITGPGSTLMTIAPLDELKLTVYISEENYGQVKLGQSVEIQVDSFPGEKFQGDVVYIADQAEFTPRNVQTVEGRKTTVYAIKILVDNPTGELKPGMPTDVIFE
jgi:HlyD family secretion protein